MESPTRLSQSRFFRFGRLSSSKASRKSSSSYSNHSFTAHPALEVLDHNCAATESSYAGSEIIYQQLNHRSASMSTLPSSMPPGTYTPLPYGENFGLNQPRLTQLQSLEAKMASIAVSLSGGGRRVVGSLPQQVSNLRNSPSVDTVRSSKASSTTSSHQRTSGVSSSKQMRNEIDLLRKIIQEKDSVIQTLQQQREQQGATMAAVLQQQNNVTGSRATSNERQQIERRLALINRDLEMKRAAIKNLRLSLQQTNVSDNIDSRIRQAETEYQLEREETNLLNLQEEKRGLLLRFGGAIHQWGRNGNLPVASSLFRILHGHAPLLIVINKVDYDGQDPGFKLHYQNSNENANVSSLDTCTVQWARDDVGLKVGDKLLEINGQLIPGLERLDVNQLLVSGPMEVVVARQSKEEAHLVTVQELTGKFDKVSLERDALKGDNLRLKHRISYLEEVRRDEDLAEEIKSVVPVQQQHDSLSSGESQSLYKSEIKVPAGPVRQKPPRTSKIKSTSETGDAKAPIVDKHHGHVIRVTHHHHPPPAPSTGSSQEYAASRRQRQPVDSASVSDLQSVASYDSFADRHNAHHHHHHVGQSMDTVSNMSLSSRHFSQRAPPSPTRSEVQSVASMDLDRRHHGYISDEQTISSSMSYSGLLTSGKKPKPVPPRKPSFLYLNRASSLQSVNGMTKTHSMDRPSKAESKNSVTEAWNNNTAPKSSLRTALSSNLKWNILSSSRTKNLKDS